MRVGLRRLLSVLIESVRWRAVGNGVELDNVSHRVSGVSKRRFHADGRAQDAVS
jgi:hypothetical protein